MFTLHNETTPRLSSSACRLFTKKQIVSKSAVIYWGKHVLRNPLSLCLLLPRASVCICCTNERNKSFRGPREGEGGGRPAKARLKRGPPSGQLPWSWQWEQKTARMMETWPRNLLPPFLLPLTPTPCELLSVDDRWPSVSFTIKPLVPISARQSPMSVVHTCARSHIYASSNFLLTPWRSVGLPSCTLTFWGIRPRCTAPDVSIMEGQLTNACTPVCTRAHTHTCVCFQSVNYTVYAYTRKGQKVVIMT